MAVPQRRWPRAKERRAKYMGAGPQRDQYARCQPGGKKVWPKAICVELERHQIPLMTTGADRHEWDLVTFQLYAYGFRPHFLAAGLAACVLIPLWASAHVFSTPLFSAWPPTLWHGHEMLFGFLAAAIAGFLLTAVPSWTGGRGFAGGPLVFVSSLWLLGRICVAASSRLPPAFVAAV